MRRLLPGEWLGVCLFLSLSAGGCQHNRPCTSCGMASVSASAKGTPVGLPSNATAAAYAPRATQQSPSYQQRESVPVHTAAKPILSASPNAAPFAAESIPSSTAEKQEAAEVAPTMDSPPRFGHDPNYRWLVGTLDYSRIQRGWLLRYVPVQQEDRYGGCVMLVAPNHETSFKHGQTVRVEGTFIDPESRQLRPAYRVETVRVEQP
jgi:hypothetical protein